MPHDRPLGVAVLGCGRIATAHLDAVAALPALGRVIATVDADPTRAAALADRHGAIGSGDYAAVLARDDVDAVIVCTPNALHTAHSLAALAAGKHVLVEKPFAETLVDARAMAEAADAAGLVLAVGHTFRHNVATRHMQDHWADYGRLLALESALCVFWDGPQAPWWATRTPAEGLILSLFAPHALDFVQLVMGADDPVRVHAEGARHQTGWQGEDEVMILLGYPGKRMATVHVSYNQRHVTDRKTLYFDRGVLEIDAGARLFWNGVLQAAPAGPVAGAHAMSGRNPGGYFQTQFAEFAAAVRGRPHRAVLHHDACRLIALIDRVKAAARMSLDAGGR